MNIIEWNILSNIVAVISPVIIVIITYTKTWSSLQVAIESLTTAVKSLTEIVNSIREKQIDILQRLAEDEKAIRTSEKRLSGVMAMIATLKLPTKAHHGSRVLKLVI